MVGSGVVKGSRVHVVVAALLVLAACGGSGADEAAPPTESPTTPPTTDRDAAPAARGDDADDDDGGADDADAAGGARDADDTDGATAADTEVDDVAVADDGDDRDASRIPPASQAELDDLLLDLRTYGQLLFTVYDNSYFLPMNLRGGDTAVSAEAEPLPPAPVELGGVPDGWLPVPCSTEDMVERHAHLTLRQPHPNMPGTQAFLTMQVIGDAIDEAAASAVLDAVRTCSESGLLRPVGSTDSDVIESAILAAGADDVVAAADSVSPQENVRAVTARVGQLVVHLGMITPVMASGDFDADAGLIALGNELVAVASAFERDRRRAVASGDDLGDDPLATTRITISRTNADGLLEVWALGGGEPDELLWTAPSDRRIARVQVAPDHRTIAVIHSDASEEPISSGTRNRQLTLSLVQPDGSTVDVITVERQDSDRQERYERLANPTWNVDGSWLAFEWSQPSPWGEVWIVRPDGSGLERVGGHTGPEWYHKDESPVWGPDPEIVYVDSARTRRGSTWRISTDGAVEEHVSPEIGDDSQISNHSVSPDGRWMVMTNLANTIVVQDLSDGSYVELPPVPDPSSYPGGARWSGDSRFVAYHRCCRPSQLLVVDVEELEVRRFTKPDEVGAWWVWASDGRTLIFGGEEGIWSMSIDDGEFDLVRAEDARITVLPQ